MKKRVLCLVVTGFEEIETIAPIDLLRRGEAEVVIAALGRDKLVTGRSGISLETDATLTEVADQDFDMLLIPGGPGVKALRTDGRPAQLAKRFIEQNKLVAAICAAPTVLADAGLLNNRRFTAHFSVHKELPGVLAEERVVKDGNLITSRGAGTAVEFGLVLVAELFGPEKSADVAKAIMV